MVSAAPPLAAPSAGGRLGAAGVCGGGCAGERLNDGLLRKPKFMKSVVVDPLREAPAAAAPCDLARLLLSGKGTWDGCSGCPSLPAHVEAVAAASSLPRTMRTFARVSRTSASLERCCSAFPPPPCGWCGGVAEWGGKDGRITASGFVRAAAAPFVGSALLVVGGVVGSSLAD